MNAVIRGLLQEARRHMGTSKLGAMAQPEAATTLGISKAELSRLIRSGQVVTCRNDGGQHLVPISQVLTLRARLRARRP